MKVKTDVTPCHQDIFAIRLMLEAVEKGQMDFGFGVPVGLQLLWKQPNLLSQLGYGFGSLCPRDLYITEGYRNMQKERWKDQLALCTNEKEKVWVMHIL